MTDSVSIRYNNIGAISGDTSASYCRFRTKMQVTIAQVDIWRGRAATVVAGKAGGRRLLGRMLLGTRVVQSKNPAPAGFIFLAFLISGSLECEPESEKLLPTQYDLRL